MLQEFIESILKFMKIQPFKFCEVNKQSSVSNQMMHVSPGTRPPKLFRKASRATEVSLDMEYKCSLRKFFL